VNWVPADIFPGRVRHDDYRRLLTLARDSGVNMLRVWGGGLREKRSFYDLCDELGLLVWQEFPFACEFLGTFPQDHSYLSFVSDECGDIVRQVQPHPSLLAWCGGNEFSRRRNRLLLSTLNRVVKEYDDKRPFIPVSPSVPDGGDAHNWHVWHGESSFNAYQRETARMLSEFGVQALPDARTLSTCLPAPADPSTWPGHYGDPEKIMRYSVLFKEQVNDDLLSTVGGEVLIQQSQLAQAVALQTAIEHMRRQRDSAGGVCLWQFNEPWPAISWAIVDYYGRPKLALRRLAIWYALVLVSLQFEVGRLWQAGDSFSATVWLVNDTALALPGCQIEVNIDGQVIYRQVVDSSPDKVCRVGVIDYKLNDPPRWVEATVTHQQQLLASNQYPLRWADTTLPDHRQRLRRWIAGQVLR
jgi:beta-mannosidase